MSALHPKECHACRKHLPQMSCEHERAWEAEAKFVLTPTGQSVFFAYVEAYAKKHNITREQAIIQLSNGEHND